MTPEEDESLRVGREALECSDPSQDEESIASDKAMGEVITMLREERGMSPEEVAQRAEMTVQNLEEIERGEVEPTWGELRRLAAALSVLLSALLRMVEERTPGPEGERWRRMAAEAEADSTEAGTESDDAEGNK